MGNKKNLGHKHKNSTLKKMSAARKKWNRQHPGYWVGNGNPRWNGGIWQSAKGYLWQRIGIGIRRQVHRIMAETIVGRPLKRVEVVHHINGDRSDNKPINLLICSSTHHSLLHSGERSRNQVGQYT
jgi:hypothetical protein